MGDWLALIGFAILLIWFFYYEQVMFRLYQVVFYEPGKIIRCNSNNLWINVDIQGERYDIFVPYDGNSPDPGTTISAKDGLGKHILNPFPGIPFAYSVRNMGFKLITISKAKKRRQKTLKINPDQFIDLPAGAVPSGHPT